MRLILSFLKWCLGFMWHVILQPPVHAHTCIGHSCELAEQWKTLQQQTLYDVYNTNQCHGCRFQVLVTSNADDGCMHARACSRVRAHRPSNHPSKHRTITYMACRHRSHLFSHIDGVCCGIQTLPVPLSSATHHPYTHGCSAVRDAYRCR